MATPDPAAWPNGRRPNDDVTDLAIRAVAGVLAGDACCSGFPHNRLGDGVNFSAASARHAGRDGQRHRDEVPVPADPAGRPPLSGVRRVHAADGARPRCRGLAHPGRGDDMAIATASRVVLAILLLLIPLGPGAGRGRERARSGHLSRAVQAPAELTRRGSLPPARRRVYPEGARDGRPELSHAGGEGALERPSRSIPTMPASRATWRISFPRATSSMRPPHRP